jgi:hypothetical protein
MTSDQLTNADAVLVVSIEAAAPELAKARLLLDRFHDMTRRRANHQLDPRIADAAAGLLGPVTRGVARDRAAIRTALVEPWPTVRGKARSEARLVGAE